MHIPFFPSWSTSFSLLLQIFSLILLLSEDSIKNNGFDRLYTRPFQFNNKLRDRQEKKSVSREKIYNKKKRSFSMVVVFLARSIICKLYSWTVNVVSSKIWMQIQIHITSLFIYLHYCLLYQICTLKIKSQSLHFY